MEIFQKCWGDQCKIDEGLSASKFKIWGQFEKLGKLRVEWKKFNKAGVNLKIF